jgi:dTDP-4-amino-4,6-dideoxygalactose transaminase
MTEFGCYSFHETKNYAMGEGGAIIVNEEKYMERAEIIREKGTNRRNVLRGLVDKYTWHDIGSSFLPSDLLAAVLYAQMTRYDEIMDKRMLVWNTYFNGLKGIEQEGKLRLPIIPENVTHNAHMFNILLPTSEIRDQLINSLREKGIIAYICYVPLHSAPYGIKLGYKPEDCPVTEDIASRLLRLPLYADMTKEDAEFVCQSIIEAL